MSEPKMGAAPMLTIRIPKASWSGIVIGIEKWAGRSRDDIEILSDFEIIDDGQLTDDTDTDLMTAVERYAETWMAGGKEIFGPKLMLDLVSMVRQQATDLQKAHAEVEAIHAQIAEAPHARSCRSAYAVGFPSREWHECNCWKSRAPATQYPPTT